ncbi:sacsin N-terminal ATP-binding-like domain-containing protein [Nocardia sp. NPDC059240]|uniref:sacsin N-terminal ATP-binding-like domain-containing protein n=1 Tax=Nocardia sp. NPDC059240 TaxID=3346786 RepID=UPI0036C4A74D
MTKEDAGIFAEPWANDPILASELEAQFERAEAAYWANPHLIAEHANHEDTIRVGGYSSRTLLELVQNAADAMSGTNDDDPGRVEIVLDTNKSTLYCANSGRPFSRSGLISISHAHLSGKRGDEIGRFGLGFKSVLAVSQSPQVFSRSVSFEFNSPSARETIARIQPNTKRFPILRTATLIDPVESIRADPILSGLATWATTIVKLPEASNMERLRSEIQSFASEFLLFVGSVREISLRVIGNEGFETSHASRDLGNGILRIERPDGSGDEWIVKERMHSPSREARREVGEAVSREKVKITVAVPVRHSQQRVGRFWSYFPLQDSTSASALFNAPWSVNDDRTTLLRNDYNREILRAMAAMLVDVLPRLSTRDDPAAHLDYLPARGREERSFGDNVLCAAVPPLAAAVEMVPDAAGELQLPVSLRPLDLTIPIGKDGEKDKVSENDFQAWITSPNTKDDVPHWRAYASAQRFLRLRELCVIGTDLDIGETKGRDRAPDVSRVPTRGLRTWLLEWANGGDLDSTVAAFKFAVEHQRKLPDADKARVIPTTEGMRALDDRNTVFLEQAEDITVDGAAFVQPRFLGVQGVRKALEGAGFRKLDPVAILNARIARLTAESDSHELERFWDAVDDVSVRDAAKVIKDHPRHAVKVPTQDGGWAWPQQITDIGEPLAGYERYLLDGHRCSVEVAHLLGVIREPVRNYNFDDEPLRAQYIEWTLKTLNGNLGPGERPIERISVYPKGGNSPGPCSMLVILETAAASSQIRVDWTERLLAHGDAPWDCEDIDSGTDYTVISPLRWAVEHAGLVRSTKGPRRPDQVVASSLAAYRDLLPLFMGPSTVAQVLALPDVLGQIPVAILQEALAVDLLPPAINDDVLAEFIVAASTSAYPDSQPPKIPARVGRAVESRPPKSVYTATTDEQRDFLKARQRPYLFTTAERAAQLIETVGCLRFEDTFSFSMSIDGVQPTEDLLDVFTGLRYELVADSVTNAKLIRAAKITKRVTTDSGVEDQSVDWHLDGVNLIVQNSLDDHQVLDVVNTAFALRLTNADLANVRKAGLDDYLEGLRQQALAADTDAERLEIYFGDDDLRDELPKGLWRALKGQRLVDESTSVAELYLTVYGSDSIKRLAEPFRREGFTDVPNMWAGGGSTIGWLRRMGFGTGYAGRRAQHEDSEFVVPGAIRLNSLHSFQQSISQKLRAVLTEPDENGRAQKAMVELPTGAGKTRVATETVLRLFTEDALSGVVLWIAQSQELCEQAVQTWSTVWRGLGDERPLTIGRLWDRNDVHEPDTEFSVIVATDAKLDSILNSPEYAWLRDPVAVIIDEGHRAGDSERYTRLLTWLGVAGRGWARPLVGLSATPFKGTSEDSTRALAARFGNRRLSAFASNPYRELAEQGILARVRHEVLHGVDVKLSTKERDEARSMRRVNASVLDRIAQDQNRMSILVSHIMSRDPDEQVLVFTPNVLSAQILAATLRYRGVEAAAVSGETGRHERRDTIERFKRSEIRVLANCDLLIQGFDAPGVQVLYIARPTFSPNAYIQMAGRGLRGPANGGKAECLIVDMEDNFGDINNLLGFREYENLWTEQIS